MKKIIFDTDPGVDDAMALLLIARSKELHLLGITTVHGNLDVETTTANALTLRDRFDIDAPVAKGAAVALNGQPSQGAPQVHGRDALGEMFLPAPTSQLDPRHAAQMICDLVHANPGEVTIIAVGPLTNLALALAISPDIAGLVAGVSIMGGAFGTSGHTGNVSPVAEANIASDPYAADIVMRASWPVTMIGLDVTQATIMTEDYLDDLRNRGGNDGIFLWEVSRFYQDFHEKSRSIKGIFAHDSLAVLYVLEPRLFTVRSGAIRVCVDGLCAGQTIQKPDGLPFPPGRWDNLPSQQVATHVDAIRALEIYQHVFVNR